MRVLYSGVAAGTLALSLLLGSATPASAGGIDDASIMLSSQESGNAPRELALEQAGEGRLAVPEPVSLVLFGLAALAFAWRVRRPT